MRRMIALTMMALLITAPAFAQGDGVSLPGLKARLQGGMRENDLKKALLPEIDVAGGTTRGIGIFNADVPLAGGTYALTLGLQNGVLVMIGLSLTNPAEAAARSELRKWFDEHVAALRGAHHRKDTDGRGNPRDIWTAAGFRWTRGTTTDAKGHKIPIYMVEFTD